MPADDAGLDRRGATNYAGFFRRLGAWCIDAPLRSGIGLALVYLPMRLLVFSESRRIRSTNPHYIWAVMPNGQKIMVISLWLFAAVIVPWLYTAMQESSIRQATIGKRLLGVAVANLQGNRISFGRASVRFFARLIPTLGLGYCTIFFTLRKQALHDLISGCVIVRRAG